MASHEIGMQAGEVGDTQNTVPGSDALLELKSISKRYGEVQAVRDMSLTLRRGEFISLLGPSGCGKTTTLRVIAGFEHPDTGSAEIDGDDILRVPPNQRPVNTVFQSYALFAHLNVFDNVAFGLREHKRPRTQITRAVGEALDLIRMRGYEQRKPSELSGGQQQRVALARAIVNEPRLLLLDEPLGALDLKLRRVMQFELKAIQRRLGMTFLYVTHDQEEAFAMSDRIAVMEKGRIVQLGSPEEIYERPCSTYVADFVGDANMLRGTLNASRDDIAIVELSSGHRLGCRPTPTSEGTPVTLIVRPEKIEMTRDDERRDPHALGVSGMVEDAVFLGSVRRFVVAADDGSRVVVTELNHGDRGERPHVGEGVRLRWLAGDAWAVTE
jgi:spermidine/putrescine transport system ATP-binding protein